MKHLVVLLVFTAALASCGESPTLDPPQVYWGQDVCEDCGMILSDHRYAGAIVAIADGQRQVHLFDDMGEMLASTLTPKGPSKRWVCDAQTKQWIDAASAFYVKSPNIHTPMGHGIVAFADASQAKAKQVEVDGQLLQFSDFSTPSQPKQ